MPIHVKYEVRDIKGNLMNEHATYTMIDSKQIDEVISDDLVIVEINGFPVTEEREVA